VEAVCDLMIDDLWVMGFGDVGVSSGDRCRGGVTCVDRIDSVILKQLACRDATTDASSFRPVMLSDGTTRQQSS
jgi:hypothetical protein